MTLGRGREARRDAAYAALTDGDVAVRLGAVYALVELRMSGWVRRPCRWVFAAGTFKG